MLRAGRAVEYGFTTFVFLTVLLVTFATQDRIQVNGGRGYDGVRYYDVASQLAAESPVRGTSRFAARLGTPWLAAHVDPDDLISGFQTVNLVAAFLSTVLFLAWLRQHLAGPSWLRLLFVVVYASHWLQLIRFTVFYPVLVDACAQALCFAGLTCISSDAKAPSALKLAAIAAISAVGVAFREVVLLVPIAFLFAANPRLGWRAPKAPPLRQWVPLLLAAVAFGMFRSSVEPSDGEFSASAHLLEGTLSRSALSYVLGWLVAFGPALGLVLLRPAPALRFFRQHAWALVYIAGVAIIAWSGSQESERHALNWGAPVVYLLIALTLQEHLRRSTALLVVLVASQALVSRWFWAIPQPAGEHSHADPTMVLTPLGAAASYHHLFPDNLPRASAWEQLAQHLMVIAAIGTLMWWRSLERTPGLLAKTRAAVRDASMRIGGVIDARAAAYRRLGARTVLGILAASFLVSVASGAALIAAYRSQPVRVNVRWKPHVNRHDRWALERQLHLGHGALGEGATWVYMLDHPSPARVRDVVLHPAVDDTAHVDRDTFRPEAAAEMEARAWWLAGFLGLAFAITALTALDRGARPPAPAALSK